MVRVLGYFLMLPCIRSLSFAITFADVFVCWFVCLFVYSSSNVSGGTL
jgi:hypothetical protein